MLWHHDWGVLSLAGPWFPWPLLLSVRLCNPPRLPECQIIFLLSQVIFNDYYLYRTFLKTTDSCVYPTGINVSSPKPAKKSSRLSYCDGCNNTSFHSQGTAEGVQELSKADTANTFNQNCKVFEHCRLTRGVKRKPTPSWQNVQCSKSSFQIRSTY